MNNRSPIALVPLTPAWHVAVLQQVYWATPGYWELYNFSTAPAGQAEHDLHSAAETPGRTLLGIVRQVEDSPGTLAADAPQAEMTAGGELIGLIDFRLHWPNAQTAYIGMMMVAEPYQRQGIGRQAWALLQPWLTHQAQMQHARLAVEQFNPIALQFFESLGFQMTGEAHRLKVGDKFVRLLYMELPLVAPAP